MRSHTGVIPDIQAINDRVRSVVESARSSAFWREMISEATPVERVRALVRELYFEAYSYHRHVYEAAATIIARLPPSCADTIDQLFQHLAEETTHGEMALQCYLDLGGRREAARERRISPGAFMVAAFWRGLAEIADPFSYLGAMYLFEASTPLLSEDILKALRRKGLMATGGGQHADEHVKADARHSQMLAAIIENILSEGDAARRDSVAFGLEGFALIYPGSILNAACLAASRADAG
jgi:hypothetical protein